MMKLKAEITNKLVNVKKPIVDLITSSICIVAKSKCMYLLQIDIPPGDHA